MKFSQISRIKNTRSKQTKGKKAKNNAKQKEAKEHSYPSVLSITFTIFYMSVADITKTQSLQRKNFP